MRLGGAPRLTVLLLKLRRGAMRGESGGEGPPMRPRDDGRRVDMLIELVPLWPGRGEAEA